MPGPGGHHGGPGGHHGGPHGGHRPPMGGGMWHRPFMGGRRMGHRPPPRRYGCCGCLLPVMGAACLLITALLVFLF